MKKVLLAFAAMMMLAGSTMAQQIGASGNPMWTETMSYCSVDDEYASSVGTEDTIFWGMKIDAAALAGRNNLLSVQMFAYYLGAYRLDIYVGTPDGTPDYTQDFVVTANDQGDWKTLTLATPMAIDQTQDLWITFFADTIPYPAIYADADPYYANAGLVSMDGTEWYEIAETPIGPATWMIRATSDTYTAQAPTAWITGPESAIAGMEVVYTANSNDPSATFVWTVDGTAPANANASTLTTSFATPGIHTLTLVATNAAGPSAPATFSVDVINCEAISDFPWEEGFEEGISTCTNLIDADGDGYNWFAIQNTNGGIHVHGGEACATSASYSGAALTPDNWMILPAFAIPADASNFTLSWWAMAQDPSWADEHYAVYIATSNSIEALSATNAVYEGESTGEYVQQTVSLANYVGQTIYIAFRHYECTDMFRLNIDDIRVGAGTQGIENAEAANVAIFPNPVRDMLTVNGENVKSVEVIDVNGSVVLTSNRAGQIDMSELSDGVYMVRVMSENGVSTKKIVKK